MEFNELGITHANLHRNLEDAKYSELQHIIFNSTNIETSCKNV